MLQPLDTTCKKPLLLFFTSGQVSDAQWLSRPMIERNMFVVIQSWWVVCKLNAGITWNLLQMCWIKCLLKRIDNSFERVVVPGIRGNQDQSIFCLNKFPSEKFDATAWAFQFVHDWPWPLFFSRKHHPKTALFQRTKQNHPHVSWWPHPLYVQETAVLNSNPRVFSQNCLKCKYHCLATRCPGRLRMTIMKGSFCKWTKTFSSCSTCKSESRTSNAPELSFQRPCFSSRNISFQW